MKMKIIEMVNRHLGSDKREDVAFAFTHLLRFQLKPRLNAWEGDKGDCACAVGSRKINDASAIQ
jgi:hypothetical protein